MAEMRAALHENLAAAYRPSRRRLAAMFFALGCAILAMIAFLPGSVGLWRLPIYFLGIGTLAAAVIARDYRYPETCLILLIDLNATFWAAHIAWLLRMHFTSHPIDWVDPYPAAQVIWLLPLAAFAPVQAIVFWVGMRVDRQRSTAVAGLIGLFLQFWFTWPAAHRLSGLH